MYMYFVSVVMKYVKPSLGSLPSPFFLGWYYSYFMCIWSMVKTTAWGIGVDFWTVARGNSQYQGTTDS